MSKTRMGKRVASLLLSLVMMLSLLPTTVYATGGTGETNGANVEATNKPDDSTVGGTTSDPEAASEGEGGGGTNVSEGETAAVAKVGDIEYATLAEAIDAAQSGETVFLVSDVELTRNTDRSEQGCYAQCRHVHVDCGDQRRRHFCGECDADTGW